MAAFETPLEEKEAVMMVMQHNIEFVEDNESGGLVAFTKQGATRGVPARLRDTDTFKSRARCINCKEEGHFMRDCCEDRTRWTWSKI